MSTSAKTARTLERFHAKLAAKDYYEAHQMLRTIANRYVHSKKYEDAIQLVYTGAFSLLKENEQGSGIDLVYYLLEIYDLTKEQVNEDSINKLSQLLLNINANDPDLKNLITAINNWSSKFSDSKFGNMYLHDIMAQRLLLGEHIYEAERYLILGSHASMQKYIDLLWDWYVQSNGEDRVEDFVSRLILNYLFIFNISYAYEASSKFLNKFIELKKPENSSIDKNGFKMFYFSSEQDLNFLQLLILACQTKDQSLFNSLKSHYSGSSNKYHEELQFLGQEYFGIIAPKQSNFLQDMMSGLLGGGGL